LQPAFDRIRVQKYCTNLISEGDVLAYRFSKPASALALGAAFFVTPVLLGTTGPFTIDSAFAKQGGNGGGKGNGSGGASKGEKSSSTKAEKNQKTAKAPKEALPTEALVAASATAEAFANALPHSRIGKLKAYYVANQAALSAQAAAEETDAAAMRAAFETSALPSVVAAYEALQAAPANSAVLDAYNRIVTDAVLTGEQIAAVESTYADWRGALDADATAAEAASKAEAALHAAANKTPVSVETRTALDTLLAGKFN
jgi:hypothetical protein